MLILGESRYGHEELIAESIKGWIKGHRDYLFSRVFNICSGLHTSSASVGDRSRFWESVAFQNFVFWSVGEQRNHRPTQAMYETAKPFLGEVLDLLKPSGVWILGREQAAYSESIITASGIECEVAPHPCARRGASTFSLQQSWERLRRECNSRNRPSPSDALSRKLTR